MNNRPFTLIAGPCAIEPFLISTTIQLLRGIMDITGPLGVPTVFKLSYDKANRTSLHSYRGPGKNVKESINALNDIIDGHTPEADARLLVDVHEVAHLKYLDLDCIDVLQIPAFLCRQTDLLVECGRTGKIVNIKKGQFMPASAMQFAIEKCNHGGAKEVWVTERGSCYGGAGDLVVDFRSLDIIKDMGVPYFFDISHSSQVIGSVEGVSGGSRKHQMTLARAAIANCIAGIYCEVHKKPEKAWSDRKTQLPLRELGDLLVGLKKLDDFVKKGISNE